MENNCTVLVSVIDVSATIGMALSTFAFALLLLTAVLFHEWRKNYKNQLLIQFMFARFLYTLRRYKLNMVYVFDENVVVKIRIFMLVYTELALVLWMFIFSKHMYDCFVKVFNGTRPNLCIVTLVTWLAPAVVTFIIYFYSYLNDDMQYTKLLICLFFFKWPVLCANGVMIVLILKSILSLNLSSTEKNVRIVFVGIVLIFSFCVQQVILDVCRLINKLDNIGLAIVFLNIFTMYHCAFSIFFWLFGNAKTRALWTCR